MICKFDSSIIVNGQLNVQAALPPEKGPSAPHLKESGWAPKQV
jgi:hypothetical protein